MNLDEMTYPLGPSHGQQCALVRRQLQEQFDLSQAELLTSNELGPLDPHRCSLPHARSPLAGRAITYIALLY